MKAREQYLRKHYGTKPWLSIYAGYGVRGAGGGLCQYGHNLISKATVLDAKAPDFLHVTFCGCYVIDEDKIVAINGVLIYYVWDSREVVKIDKSPTIAQLEKLLADKGNCKDSSKLLSEPNTFMYVVKAKDAVYDDYIKVCKKHGRADIKDKDMHMYFPDKFDIDAVKERNATAAKSYQYTPAK